MISQNHILSLMQGRTSQQPMAKSELLNRSALSPLSLDTALNEMYALGRIGKCTHTKCGITDDVYWPTGVCKLVADYGRKGEAIPPRRDLLRKKQETNVPADQTNLPRNPADEPTTLKLLEYIQKNPNCPYSDFTEKLKIAIASAFLGNHIKRGDVIKTQLGPRKFNYSLIAGKTAQEIYNDGDKRRIDDAFEPIIESPYITIKYVAPDQIDEKLTDQYTEPQRITADSFDNDELEVHPEADAIEKVKLSAADFIEAVESSITSPFKIALTTNKTLILFGLSYQPIELNHQQSRQLSDFFSELDIAAYLI